MSKRAKENKNNNNNRKRKGLNETTYCLKETYYSVAHFTKSKQPKYQFI